jgi:hypothetical protein
MSRSKSDGSVYLVPLPGLGPEGLHVSQHPSGEFHLKTKDPALQVKIDVAGFVKAAFSGQLDRVLGSMFRPPPSWRPAKAIILPTSTIPAPNPSLRREDVAFDDLLENQIVVELEDSADVGALIKKLAADGQLRPGDSLQIEPTNGDDVSMFRYVGPQPTASSEPAAPPSGPLAETMQALGRMLTEFGGVFLTFSADEFERMKREMPEIGEIADGVERMMKSLGSEEEQKRMLEPFLTTFGPAASRAAAKRPLKFDSQERETS